MTMAPETLTEPSSVSGAEAYLPHEEAPTRLTLRSLIRVGALLVSGLVVFWTCFASLIGRGISG